MHKIDLLRTLGWILLISILLSSIIALANDALAEVVSAPFTESAPLVDGDSSDWSDRLVEIDDDIDVAAVYDEDGLYLCILFADSRQRQQLMAMGLELTLKPNTDALNRVLRYPLPAMDRAGGRDSRERPSGEEIAERFAAQAERFSWKDGEKYGPVLALDELQPVEVAARAHQGVYVYEIRIPRGATDSWGAGKRTQLSLSLATPAIERPEGSIGSQGGMRGSKGGGQGGGRGGMSGGRGGGAMGGRGAGGPSRGDGGAPSSIKVELHLRLTQ